MALLSHPGGLYLDVKSAYSTAADIATFVGSLTALGITTQAVCSFVPAQLPDGLPNVLFFHGLSGLEARRPPPPPPSHTHRCISNQYIPQEISGCDR